MINKTIIELAIQYLVLGRKPGGNSFLTLSANRSGYDWLQIRADVITMAQAIEANKQALLGLWKPKQRKPTMIPGFTCQTLNK